MLKQHLEDLVKEGHQKEYIGNEHAKRGPGGLDQKGEKNLDKDRSPIGVIDVVHGARNSTEVTTQSVRT